LILVDVLVTFMSQAAAEKRAVQAEIKTNEAQQAVVSPLSWA
jgi:hypothetical protein